MDDKPDMYQMTEEEANLYQIEFRRAESVLGREVIILALLSGAALGVLISVDPLQWLLP